MNTEIFEIGRVSRCFGCASYETFDSLEAANEFRLTTVRSYAFFGTVTVVKTLVELLLRTMYVSQVRDDAYLIYPALDIFETLMTVYVLYCSLMFCSCLSQGIVFEWAPVEKFFLISALATIVVCQDFIIYTFLSIFPPSITSATGVDEET